MSTIADTPWVGLATSIGSLPQTDPRAAARFITRLHPELPAAPQLPRRSRLESLAGQGLQGVPGVSVSATTGKVEVDVHALEQRTVPEDDFSPERWSGLLTFLELLESGEFGTRVGPFKIQIAGPLTLGLILSHAGAPTELAFEIARQNVSARIRALLRLLQSRMPNAAVAVFLDEPGLIITKRKRMPVDAAMIKEMLDSSIEMLGPSVARGIHCCGHADWSVAMSPGVDVISMPTSSAHEIDASWMAPFLERGGCIAWGAVPTDKPLWEAADLLWRELLAAWHELERRGCDYDMVRHQAMVTPVCGLAGCSLSQAEGALALAAKLAKRSQSD